MCEVCATFGRGRHWTDRAGSVPSRPEAVDILAYRGERRQALRVVNAQLAPLGLGVRDWDGEAFGVFARSGASLKVADLGELWAAVERIGGSAVDPLSEDFASMEAR